MELEILIRWGIFISTSVKLLPFNPLIHGIGSAWSASKSLCLRIWSLQGRAYSPLVAGYQSADIDNKRNFCQVFWLREIELNLWLGFHLISSSCCFDHLGSFRFSLPFPDYLRRRTTSAKPPLHPAFRLPHVQGSRKCRSQTAFWGARPRFSWSAAWFGEQEALE